MNDEKVIQFPGTEQLPAGKDLPPPVKGDALVKSAREVAFIKFMESQEVSYDYATESLSLDGSLVEPDDLMSMLLERTELRQIIGTSHEGILNRLLRLWVLDLEKATVNRVINDMPPYDITHVQAVEDWVRLACREGDKGKDYTVVMIRQWIWQVRRALLGLDRWDHVMLIWQGEQEIGKSTSIRNFLKPLAPLWSRWDLPQIVDERHRAGLSRNYAGYVGELSGSKRADLESLKSVITESHVSYRKLNSHRRLQIPQNCSFIGDTNDNAASIFKDTQNRRFWEIRLNPKGNVNEKLIRSFPRFWEFWGSVDPENDVSPLEYSDLRHAIREAQTEELGTKTPVMEWLADQGIKEGEHNIPAFELYAAFKKWANPRQLYTGNSQWFGLQLKKDLPKRRGRVGSHVGTYYSVNKSATDLLQ